MKTKIIPAQTITSCSCCPHSRYDSHYSRSTDSGYDCHKTSKRIADDNDIEAYNRAMEKIDQYEKTLFPSTEPEPKDPMDIPDWCPLADKPAPPAGIEHLIAKINADTIWTPESKRALIALIKSTND